VKPERRYHDREMITRLKPGVYRQDRKGKKEGWERRENDINDVEINLEVRRLEIENKRTSHGIESDNVAKTIS